MSLFSGIPNLFSIREEVRPGCGVPLRSSANGINYPGAEVGTPVMTATTAGAGLQRPLNHRLGKPDCCPGLTRKVGPAWCRRTASRVHGSTGLPHSSWERLGALLQSALINHTDRVVKQAAEVGVMMVRRRDERWEVLSECAAAGRRPKVCGLKWGSGARRWES